MSTLAPPQPPIAAAPPGHAARVMASFAPAYDGGAAHTPGSFWVDRYSPGLAPYANLVNARNRRVRELAPPGRALLDIGSGYGDLLNLLKDKYSVLRGIDPSIHMVRRGEANLAFTAPGRDVRFDQGVAEALPYEAGEFDTVIMLDTYEHVEPEYRAAALREARRVLAPGGVFILATPSLRMMRFWNLVDNLLTLRRQLWMKRKRIGGVKSVHIWSYPGKDFCEEFCTPGSLRADLRAAGFTVERFERVSFYPAPERGGLMGRYLDGRDPRSRTVRWTMAFVRAMERLRVLNQKMLVVARPAPGAEGAR